MPKPRTWLSVLEEKKAPNWKPESASVSALDAVLRTATKALKESGNRELEARGRAASVAGNVEGVMADEAAAVGEKVMNAARKVTPQECQHAFNEARSQHPDSLYTELTEIAAGSLGISGRQLRKYVPNPFR